MNPAMRVPPLVPTLVAALVPVADAADPEAEAAPFPLVDVELLDVDVDAEPLDADAVEDELVSVVDADGLVVGLMLGPGPAVIIPSFPPGYVAPAAAVNSCGTAVSLLPK